MGRNKADKNKQDNSGFSLRYSVRDIFYDKPHLEITGNNTAVIEGSKGVLEYSDTVIRVNLGQYAVALAGRGLTLKCISPTSLVIDGFITNIEYSV